MTYKYYKRLNMTIYPYASSDAAMGPAAAVRRHPVALALAAVLALAAATACGALSTPSSVAVATVGVGNETFRVALNTAAQVQAARSAQAGGPARIPNGRIVAGADVNAGWSWHLEDLAFAEIATEVCDGKPSDVERAGVSYGGGRFCPWSATIIGIQP